VTIQALRWIVVGGLLVSSQLAAEPLKDLQLRLASLHAARQRSVATLSRTPRFISIEGTTIVYVIDGTSAGAIRRLAAPAV